MGTMRRPRRTAGSLTTIAAGLVLAGALAACSGTNSAQDAAVSQPQRNAGAESGVIYRPFYAVWPQTVEKPELALPKVMSESGAKEVILSGITAPGDASCKATWGGYDDKWGGVQDGVKSFIQGVGAQNVTISLGGAYSGKYLEEVCTTSELTQQYKGLVDTYGVKSFDYNIEGGERGGTTANQKRAQAMAAIAGQYAGVRFGFTVEKHPWVNGVGLSPSQGADPRQIQNVREFVQWRTSGGSSYSSLPNPSWVNLMTLHTWKSIPATQLESITTYMDTMLGQLMDGQSTLGGMTRSQVNSMLGVTTSNKETSDNKPFTVADARGLHDLAVSQGWGYLSPWIVNQDYPCDAAHTSDFCNPQVTTPYEFSKALATGK